MLSKVAEWERLNMSFFGETNAGKSTIIESLINGDGRSIGEGYKDFTKTVNKIAYKNINLLDMPGIEGKEYKVVKNIHKAVNKSHTKYVSINLSHFPHSEANNRIQELDLRLYMVEYCYVNHKTPKKTLCAII